MLKQMFESSQYLQSQTPSRYLHSSPTHASHIQPTAMRKSIQFSVRPFGSVYQVNRTIHQQIPFLSYKHSGKSFLLDSMKRGLVPSTTLLGPIVCVVVRRDVHTYARWRRTRPQGRSRTHDEGKRTRSQSGSLLYCTYKVQMQDVLYIHAPYKQTQFT